MSYLEIPLKNNTFTTRVLLINPEEVVSFEAMAAYVYKEPPIHIPSVFADELWDSLCPNYELHKTAPRAHL